MPLLTDQFMSKNLRYTHPDESLANVYHEMQEYKIRHLPVLDKSGALVGIISDRDIWRSTDLKVSLVKDFMTSRVETAAVDTPLGEVTDKMIQNKISALVVVKNKHVVGVVTHEDLLKVLRFFLKLPIDPRDSDKDFNAQTTIGTIMASIEEMGF
ncbi:MAG: CBS domain-containing protein [Bdellovibrionia bacterium]